MEKLWAPWRMSYVTVPKAEGCVFCGAPDAADLREQLVLYRGETCFVIMNLFPYNNGHLMVAPYRHTADLAALTTPEQNELMALTRYALLVLQETFQPDGFNLGMNLGRVAGSGIADHLHQHLVPRWNGDTNFMPVIGETKVLPDALYAGYDRLAATLSRLGPPSVALSKSD
jgi:ATP adenylyltransferase